MTKTRCGYVAIIGRPNVGKSTLLNTILQQKISITCRKPQTTRHQILGVKSTDNVQYLYVDTPGMHQKEPKAINRYMNKAAFSMLHDVDVIVFVVDVNWGAAEDWIVERLQRTKVPILLAVNQVDKVKDKATLLPILKDYETQLATHAVLPISAKHGDNVEALEIEIARYLPEAGFLFDPDQVTDRSERFLVAEIIREKLMRLLGQELPYAVTVEIDLFKENPETNQVDIAATILVERDSQKAMIIGKQGKKLKAIGRDARLDINTLLQRRCHLELWVKVKSGWADDERALRGLGYDLG